jgi:hypothetical protein
MATTVSGPMFEGATSGPWTSTHRKDGAHYNTYGCRDADGMAGLRQMFPEGNAGPLNFVLFSTSGVHGTYTTIEEAEAAWARGGKDEDGEEWTPNVTFLIVHPRIVCVRYGNCEPRTPEDFAFLKMLRWTSWQALADIGRPEDEQVGPDLSDRETIVEGGDDDDTKRRVE